MRILSVKLALPSRRISNQDLLALIQQHSQDSFSGDLNATLDQVCYFLERSGAKTRYWLGENESPLDLIESAVGEALTEAGLQSGEIDLMIHAGVAPAISALGARPMDAVFSRRLKRCMAIRSPFMSRLRMENGCGP